MGAAKYAPGERARQPTRAALHQSGGPEWLDATTRRRTTPISRPDPFPFRHLLLALVLFGVVGLVVELLLLEHYDSAWKLAPLIILLPTLVVSVLAWVRPSPATLRVLRATMALCVVIGAAGLILHYKGNLEFALERDPSLTGLDLLMKGFRGATPALAPGALAQLGLLGLVFAYRHPALERAHITDQEIT